jgi:SAM-dependent methyltransferase
MQNTVSQINYWDRVAREKRFSHPLRTDWLRKHSNTQARILDYGCGYGRTLAELSQAGFTNLVGADFSEQMLARARAEAPGPWLVRNDGHCLPFKDDCFDLVLLFAVLTCIPDDNEQQLLLSEARRVLRPGGMLYLSDLLINNDERNRERYERDAERFKCYGVFELPEGVVVRHHQREWVEEIVRPFEQLEYEPFTVTTMNRNSSAAFQYLGRKPV